MRQKIVSRVFTVNFAGFMIYLRQLLGRKSQDSPTPESSRSSGNSIELGVEFDAFISYSHAAGGRFAAALQKGLHQFAKPLFKLRTIRVFRDETTLKMTPKLWPEIEKALRASRFFILLADPQSAQSDWVQKEVAYWLEMKGIEKMLIVCTGGVLVWDQTTKDFDWKQTTALPTLLKGTFDGGVPLFLDLRWVRTKVHLSRRHPKFALGLARLSATIRGKSLDETFGDDVRQRRRNLRLLWGGVMILFFATVFSGLLWRRESQARHDAQKAETRTKEEASRANVSLARYSQQLGNPAKALAYLAQAVRLNPRNFQAVTSIGLLLTQNSWPIQLPVSMRHNSNIESARFSPDGLRIATASSDNTARLWDAVTGKPIGDVMTHQGQVTSVAFSRDGRKVVTASFDKTAQVWDATVGKPIGKAMRHDGGVISAQFSPDGLRIVTASEDKTARLWNAVTGEPLSKPMKHQDHVWAAQFSSDGKRVVTASEDKTVQVWDAFAGEPIGKVMKHEGAVLSGEFSPDGKWVVTAAGDIAQVFDWRTGMRVGKPMKHENYVFSARFSPDGQLVLTASYDATARLWDAITGAPFGTPLKHDGPVNSAEFSPDGQRVVTASDDKTVQLWDVSTSKPLGQAMRHEDRVIVAKFSPDGQQVLTVSKDQPALLWDLSQRQEITELLKHRDRVSSAEFSPDGQFVVTASKDATARLWVAANGEPIGEVMRHQGPVDLARFSPDGQRVMTISGNVTRLWSATTGKPLGVAMEHEGEVLSGEFSPDGQKIVTASADGKVRLWNATTGKSIGVVMEDEDVDLSARFSPNSKRIVTASMDKTARLWDATTGKQIGKAMKHEGKVTIGEFSPDGLRLVTWSQKAAHLWDASSGESIGEAMGHKLGLKSARFSPDGKEIVTASVDKTARVWDAASGRPIGETMEHKDEVLSARFSPDSKLIITTSSDGAARLWDTETCNLLGAPMRDDLAQSEDAIYSADFSPDGKRLVTTSANNSAQVWDILTLENDDKPEDLLLLADVAEANCGLVSQLSGQPEMLSLSPDSMRATRSKITAKYPLSSSSLTTLQRFLRWSVLDIEGRTVSPFSDLLIPQWIEKTIKEAIGDQRSASIKMFDAQAPSPTEVEDAMTEILDETKSLQTAMLVDPTNVRLDLCLGLRLVDFGRSLAVTMPYEARKAKQRANFLALRALNLDPNSDEVKRLYAEVMRQLQLPDAKW